MEESVVWLCDGDYMRVFVVCFVGDFVVENKGLELKRDEDDIVIW